MKAIVISRFSVNVIVIRRFPAKIIGISMLSMKETVIKEPAAQYSLLVKANLQKRIEWKKIRVTRRKTQQTSKQRKERKKENKQDDVLGGNQKVYTNLYLLSQSTPNTKRKDPRDEQYTASVQH